MGKLFDEAITFAVAAHAGQFRKGTNIPYITHPMEVAAIAATMTQEDAVLAAAVLHDVVEDTGFCKADLLARFGPEVAELVAAESEDKREDRPAADTWVLRKQETLDHLAHASRETKMIALGDKLSNIRAMARDYAVLGDGLWQRFNQKDPAQHKWYYAGVAQRLTELAEFPVYREYVRLVDEVFGAL